MQRIGEIDTTDDGSGQGGKRGLLPSDADLGSGSPVSYQEGRTTVLTL